MSIATQIQRLNTAKANIKNSVNIDFNKITNQTIDGYSALIDSTIEEYKNYIPQATVSGVPVHIDDGVGALKPINLKIEGNTTQETTTGKNLLKCDFLDIGNSRTNGGLTLTRLGQSRYMINGTSTQGDLNFYIQSFTETELVSFTNGDYLSMASLIKSGTGNENLFITCICKRNDNNQYVYNYITNKKEPIQMNFSGVISAVSIYIGSKDVTFNNLIFDIAVYKSNEKITELNYEAYTGGIASPNPSYPQSIESVGELNGYKVLSNSFVQTNAYGNSYNNRVSSNQAVFLKANKTYIFETNLDLTKYKYDFCLATAPYPLTSQTLIGGTDTGWQTVKKVYEFSTTQDSYLLLLFACLNGTTALTPSEIANYTFEIYEQGKKYAIPVTVASENLFDITKITENRYIDGYKGNEHGKIGTSSVTNLSDYMKVNSNKKYCFKYDYTTLRGTGNRGYIFYDKNKNVLNKEIETVYSSINKETYITSFENAEYIRIAYDKNCNNIEFFETETSYIYLNEPLRKIGDTMDYVDFGEKENKRYIKRVILNGSENWLYSSGWSKTDTNVFYLNLTTKEPLNQDSIYVISNYFKGYSRHSLFNLDINGICFSGGNGGFVAITIRISKTIASNLADFKSWLSSNNVTVDYILAEPTTETIELPEILLVDGANNISVETKIEPSNIKLNYYKDWRVA